MFRFNDYRDEIVRFSISALGAGAVYWFSISNPSLIFATITALVAGGTSIYDITRLVRLNNSITILVLEDDPQQLEQIKEGLELLYFKVEGFRNSNDAIKRAKKDKNIKFGVIDELLLVDGTNRRQNRQGKDVIDILVQIRPDMRFIVLTGRIGMDAYNTGTSVANIDVLARVLQQYDKFLDTPNVVDVIRKNSFKIDTVFESSLYNRIADKIKLLIKAGDVQ